MRTIALTLILALPAAGVAQPRMEAKPAGKPEDAAARRALKRFPGAYERYRQLAEDKRRYLGRDGRLMGELDPLIWARFPPEELLERLRSSLDPDSSADWGVLAQNELRYGSPQNSIEAANKAVQLEPRDADALATRAGARYRLGDFSGAYKDAVSAAAVNPRNAAALSLIRRYEGRLASAEPEPSAEEAAPHSNLRMREGVLAMSLKDYETAERKLGLAVSLNPANGQAYVLRAGVRLKLGRAALALEDTRTAQRLGHSSVDALNIRALSLNRLGRYAEADEAAREALLLSPKDPRSWFNRAFAADGRRERAPAVEALRQAAASDPWRYEPLYRKAAQVPPSADLSFLFRDGTAFPQPPAPRPSRAPSLWLIVAATVSGGVLIALGLLRAALRWSEGGPKLRVAGGYEVVRKIAIGGMGVVYEGIDAGLGRRVAIKQMREDIRMDPHERERFLKEARIVAALQHPNIVTIHAIAEEDGEDYMVFEFVEGRSLAEILAKEGSLPWTRALGILRDACAGLHYAHERKLIHRDLKPGNIMVSNAGPAKLMDFGIARAWSPSAMTDTAVGTPLYMAPEQEQGRAAPTSDVYSLAACFYEMITGRPPFQGAGRALYAAKSGCDFPPVSSLAAGLPPGADAALRKALDPEPERRFASAPEFLRALETA